MQNRRRKAVWWFPVGFMVGGTAISLGFVWFYATFEPQSNASGERFVTQSTPEWFVLQLAWAMLCRVISLRIRRMNCPSCGGVVTIPMFRWPFGRTVKCRHCDWRLELESRPGAGLVTPNQRAPLERWLVPVAVFLASLAGIAQGVFNPPKIPVALFGSPASWLLAPWALVAFIIADVRASHTRLNRWAFLVLYIAIANLLTDGAASLLAHAGDTQAHQAALFLLSLGLAGLAGALSFRIGRAGASDGTIPREPL